MTITYRPLRDADYDALAAMLTESYIADGRPIRQAGVEIREDFESLPVDLATHTFSAWSEDQLVGAAYAYHVRSEVRMEVCFVFGAVHPAFCNRGIGRRLLHDAVIVAEQLLRQSQSQVPKMIRATASISNTPAMHLFEREGLKVVRYFADLHRPLTEVPRPRSSGDFRVVPWDLSRNDEALVVKNTAFLDHWGSVPMSQEWWKNHTTGFGSRLDLSFFAVDPDGAIVGYLLSHRYEHDDELLGGKYAWIDNIGTLAEWRGKGIATQLITTALNAYRGAGIGHAALNVDSDNPTGAFRLYESLGFRPWRRTVMFERDLAV